MTLVGHAIIQILFISISDIIAYIVQMLYIVLPKPASSANIQPPF